MSNEIRFYAADLAAYNNGILHGVWINADSDINAMQDEINAMLRKSPCPNVTVEDPETGKQVPSAEEWAIHDYEGMPSTFGEYTGLAEIAEYAELAEEHSEIDEENLCAIVAGFGSVDLARQALDGNFCGIHNSFKDYARERADEMLSCYGKEKEVQWLIEYFDYDAYASDLEMGMNVIDLPDYRVAVFYA